ncbi:MAG: PIN domain-containing protein [Pyrobaculum sp.]|uniref:PIN domain-containing protein n=1 Tax=Pyrobaculum sp. TaxID=2004705 RepID=UPI0031646E3A
MRSRRGTSRVSVIVDTSFLLPTLGVEVEEECMEVIPLFRKAEVWYLEVALLEAMWKILKLVGREKLERVRLGLEAIRASYRVAEPPPEAYTKAVEIFDKGHRDYIDALHYATASALGAPFLTVDYRFIDFLRGAGYRVEGVVITPRELRKMLGGSLGK